MEPGPDPIVRRDFPLSEAGYDRTAVEAHLEAIAAALRDDGRADHERVTADAEHELLAHGRLLLGQISAMRAELQRLSSSLLAQSATIAEALEQLHVEESAAVPVPPDLSPAPPPPPPPAPEARATLEDARLVALDLALGGSSREEIDRQLAARFELSDRAALVEEVLAAIG